MVDYVPIAGYETYTEYVIEPVTWKTTPTNPVMKWFGGVEDVIIRPNVDIREEFHLKGQAASTHRELDSLKKGKKTFSVHLPIQPQKIGGAYSWVDLFTLAQGAATGQTDTLPTFTLNRVTNGINFVALGCMVDKFKFQMAKDDTVKMELDAVAGDFDTAAVVMGSGTHAVDPDTEHLWWSDAYVDIDGTPIDAVRDFEFTIDQNLKHEPRIRQTDPDLDAFIKPGQYLINGKLTLDFLDYTQFNEFIAGTEIDIGVTMNGYYIWLEKCKFSGTLEYGARPTDLIAEPLPFKARWVTVTT